MNKLIPLILVVIISTFGCQSSQEVLKIESRIVLSVIPIWINCKCEGKTVKCRFEHVIPKVLEVRIDGKMVEIKLILSNAAGVQYGEIFVPATSKYTTLEILNRGTEELVVSEDIISVQIGDTIMYFRSNIILPRPIIVNDVNCLTDSKELIIPQNQDCRIHYDLVSKTLLSASLHDDIAPLYFNSSIRTSNELRWKQNRS